MHPPGLQCLWLPPLPASGTVLPRCFQSRPEACAPAVPSAESSLLDSVCTVPFLSLSFPFLLDGTFSGCLLPLNWLLLPFPCPFFPERLYLAYGVVSSFVICASHFLRAFLPSVYLWTPLGLPCPPATPSLPCLSPLSVFPGQRPDLETALLRAVLGFPRGRGCTLTETGALGPLLPRGFPEPPVQPPPDYVVPSVLWLLCPPSSSLLPLSRCSGFPPLETPLLSHSFL